MTQKTSFRFQSYIFLVPIIKIKYYHPLTEKGEAIASPFPLYKLWELEKFRAELSPYLLEKK